VKRVLVVVGLSAVLGLSLTATGANAGSVTESARAGENGGAQAAKGARLQLRFVVVKQGRVPIAIKRFRFTGLRTSCNTGTVTLRGKVGRINVNNNRFRHTIRKPAGTVRIKGRFRSGGNRVKGTIRGRGNFGGQNGCDSGKVRWRAS
jgi:hypothetical protein